MQTRSFTDARRVLRAAVAWLVLQVAGIGTAAWAGDVQVMPLGPAWAANSINTVVFRNDPVTTAGDKQYAAYYNAEGKVVIASRTIGQSQWETTVTSLSANVKDAHNSISIIADGEGFLHVAWNHHNNQLHYVRSKSPGSLEFTEMMPMTGKNEGSVSYPQFYRLANGNLMFLYRDGASGRGNLVVDAYDAKSQQWTQVHENLISGENARNAYWQACVDGQGAIHVSWVWRESPDVATNHDLCYARSDDGGQTWKRSDGSAYELPITAATAEIAQQIPQRHELINQTSMCTDSAGHPIIATYFRPEGQEVVQYFIVSHDGSQWKMTQATQRKTPFSLSGGGSKQIPISRPQVFARTDNGKTSVWMVYRDIERENRVSMAYCPDLSQPNWSVRDLTDFTVRYWEPSYDRVRWQRDGILDLYVQFTGQGDGETLEAVEPQPAQVVELTPEH